MDDEKINLLVSEDDLNPVNNVNNDNVEQNTEVLDFSNLNEEYQKAVEETNQFEQPMTSVPLEPVYDEEPKDDEQSVNLEGPTELNENPAAKVILNTTEEETKEENIDPKSVKLDLKGNKSLMFVLGLGLLILIAIFVIPYII